MEDVSRTYFEDAFQSEYRKRLSNSTVEAQTISFFSGPGVNERVHGRRAWGTLTNLTCSPTHPYIGLQFLNVTDVDD